TFSTSFPGYDGSHHNSNCNPAIGRFTPGHYYKVTRGVWSTACPWKASSMVVYMSTTGNFIVKDVEAPDYTDDAIAKLKINKNDINIGFNIYPNPSSGIFTASIERFSAGDLVQVLDYSGKVIIEKNID